jgi:PKD repeat protein
MKKNLQFFKKIKMITTLSFLFLLSFQLKSQCNGSFSATAGAPGVVNFSSTSVGISTSVSYSWLFGDGTSLYYNPANANVSHTYTANGNYNVIMIMLDYGNNCSDTVYNTITVNNIPNPFACNIVASFSSTLGNLGIVNFSSTSTGISANAGYSWYFGDGTVLNNSASNANVVHTYTNNGTYNVYMILRDFNSFGNLCQDTVNYFAVVSNIGALPCPTAYVNYTSGNNGIINFVSATINASPNAQYSWFFGDGTLTSYSTANSSISHTYANNGTYSIWMVVLDNVNGQVCRDTAFYAVNVSNVILPCNVVANFNYTVGSNGSVNFVSTSTGTNANTEYSWIFDDGSALNYGISNNNVIHTYANNGIYNARIITKEVIGAQICLDTLVKQVTITGLPCTANASFTLAKDTTVALRWEAYPNYSGTIVSAKWLWGDGTSTIGYYPSHNYASAGLYNVCLIVTEGCGVIDTTCINYNIFKVSGSNAMISLDVKPSLILNVNSIHSNETKFKIFPNPSSGEFTIISESNTEFTIVNELGQVIKSDVINTGNNFTAKVSGLNSGIYFITGTSEDKTFRQRIVVAK